jgi:hypothetical protein
MAAILLLLGALIAVIGVALAVGEQPELSDADPLVANEDEIDLATLPPEVRAPIQPFLGNSRFVTRGRLCELYAEATRLLAARERYLTHETKTLDRQNELILAGARAAYLATLSHEEQMLLQLWLETAAEADARAAHDCIRMECEISELRAALAAAPETETPSIHSECR